MKYLITWLLLAAGIVVGLGAVNWWPYRSLARNGIVSHAEITELLPAFHMIARYEYHVAGRTFLGQMQPWPPNPPFKQLRVGSPAIIYYDPNHLEDSVLGDPRLIRRNETFSIVLAAIVIPTFLVFTAGVRQASVLNGG
jgi:hypothetical protein